MELRKLLLGMGIALWMVACSRPPLPAPRDAGAEAQDLLARDAVAEAVSDVRDAEGRDAAGLADTREVAADPFAGRSFRIDDTNPAPTPDPTCTPSGPASAAELTFSSDLSTLTGVASSGSAAFRFSATAGPEAS